MFKLIKLFLYLSENFKELVIRLKSVEILDKKNQEALIEQTERTQVTDNAHEEFFKIRKEYADRINKQLEDNRSLNTELASRYRQLKYGIYNVKLDIMRSLDKKLDQMYNLKDKRQLKSLQSRMHAALKDFFVFKIKQSEIKFAGLEMDKENVADEIEDLEDLLNNSVRHVTRFLHNQIDFSQVRQMAMDKVREQELIEEQRMKQETQMLANEVSRLSAKTKTLKKPLPPIGMSTVVNAV